jgi:hypothetical protein
MHRNDYPASTQPMPIARRTGLREMARRALDTVAPPAHDRQMLVKMGCGRASLVGDLRTHRVSEAYHLL